MSRRGERIQRLVELARRRQDQAASRLGEQGQRIQQAVTVKNELAKFRSLYGEQRSRSGQVMTAGAMLNSHQFLNRIDQALQQQETDLGRQSQHELKLRQLWLQARQRASALQLVADRLNASDAARALRSEQEASDDIASQRFLSRNRP